MLRVFIALALVVILPGFVQAADKPFETKSVISAEFTKISETEAKITLSMPENWHTYAHKVTMDFLIPTEVTGLRTTIQYPAGEILDTPLGPISVYSDQTIIPLTLTQPDTALKLVAQACQRSTCYPPSEWIFNIK